MIKISGGTFQYNQYRITSIIDDIKIKIENNDSVEKNEWGEDIGSHYSKETIDKFKEAIYHLEKAEVMATRIDWLLAGDDGEKNFNIRWDEDLKIT